MTLPDLAEVMETLRSRLQTLRPDSMLSYSSEPLSESDIEQIRSHYRPRHLSDEFEEFLRLGPIGLFHLPTVEMHRVGPGGCRLEGEHDRDFVNRVIAERHNYCCPLSQNWVPFGYGDNMWYIVSPPAAAARSTVIFWDCGAPAAVRVAFPSIRSLLWTWAEMLHDPDGSGAAEKATSWLYCVHPTSVDTPPDPIEQRYVELREQAITAEDSHPGWVTDQPPPEDDNDWSIEWLTACGVADIDI